MTGMATRAAMAALALVACAPAAPIAVAPPPPPPPYGHPAPLTPALGCLRHVHGQILDVADRPVDHIQVSLVGDDGQDDASTDDNGRYDLRATGSAREQIVIFYDERTTSRKLSATRCDEQLDWKLNPQSARSPGVM